MQQQTTNKSASGRMTREATLTRQAVRLHLEVSNVVAAAVPLGTYALLPGSHGDGAPLGVNLLRDALEVA